MLTHATRLAALVSIIAAATASSAFAKTTMNLNDSRIGTSTHELQAQITHSTQVISFFTTGRAKWVIAKRHAKCSAVAWQSECTHARSVLKAQTWLLHVAKLRYLTMTPTGGDMTHWSCLQHIEGAWTDTSGTYQGGLQMDEGFAHTYGADFQARFGMSPGTWPIWAQIVAARRARDGYHGYAARGYGPWPNTRIVCRI